MSDSFEKVPIYGPENNARKKKKKKPNAMFVQFFFIFINRLSNTINMYWPQCIRQTRYVRKVVVNIYQFNNKKNHLRHMQTLLIHIKKLVHKKYFKPDYQF